MVRWAFVPSAAHCLCLETSSIFNFLQNLSNAPCWWTKALWTKNHTHGASYGCPSRGGKGSPPTVAPRRWGSTPMSQICDFLWQNHIKNEKFVSQDHIGGFSVKWEYKNTSHKAYNTIDMKFKWSYYILVTCIRVYKRWNSKRLLQRITQSFVETFISHDKHTLFALEESVPP
jgi:hypothetical protein